MALSERAAFLQRMANFRRRALKLKNLVLASGSQVNGFRILAFERSDDPNQVKFCAENISLSLGAELP
jgi:hypothetical protein